MKKLTVILVPIFLAACASAPKTDSQASQPAGAASKSSTAANSGTSGINQAEIEARKLEEARRLEKARNEARELQKQSVYFGFNKYVVEPEHQNVVQRQAEFVKTQKNVTVTLEGNADERGSNEYNLALGDKRANAVRKSMELLGVPATQIRVVSMGEENPRLSCHQEKCWKENRRNDFIHKFE